MRHTLYSAKPTAGVDSYWTFKFSLLMHKKAADVPNMPFCSSLSYFFRHVNYNRGSQSEFRRKINQQIKFDGYFLFSWCLPSDDNKKLNTATIAYCYVLLNYNQWFSDSKQYTIYLRHIQTNHALFYYLSVHLKYVV